MPRSAAMPRSTAVSSMDDRHQLQADLHFHRTQALFSRGKLLTEQRKAIELLQRKLDLLNRIDKEVPSA